MEHVFNSEENKRLHEENVTDFFRGIAHLFAEWSEELRNNQALIVLNPKGEDNE